MLHQIYPIAPCRYDRRMRTLIALSLLVAAVGCGSAAGLPEAPDAEAPDADVSAAAPEASAADPGPSDDDPAPMELSSKGEIDGRTYAPVVALGRQFFQQGGARHLTLELFERQVDCASKTTAKKGERQLFVSIPWQEGGKLDLSAVPPDPVMNPNKMKAWDGKRWEEVSGWKAPLGKVLVFEAPTKSGEKGRVRLVLRSGRAKLRGDVPVVLCVDA